MLFWARETRIIMMAANAGGTSATVLRAISAGAAGYFGRLADREAIFRGIALVMQGGSMMSPETAALAFRSFPHPKGRLEASGTTSTIPNRTAPARAPHMNRQELRLLSCIGRGLSGSEISRTLQLTEGTIRNYLSSIYSKTGMRNRAEVALFARQVGLSGMD
jgi:DNA-binding NarL/FixJ family response regulator